MSRIALIAATGLVVVGSAAYLACSGQNSQLAVSQVVSGNTSAVSKPQPLDGVDHSIWDRLLKKYVDDDGMVDYAAWHASRADREALKQYLMTLSRAQPDLPTSKEGKLAFWINAYNALTIHGILRVYPTSSIRNHTNMFGYNIWKDLLLPVGEKQYSLEAIEHEVLRKLGEPRIHFAIVCASVGCPRLRNEAYTPERLEEQLAENTRDFFSRRRNFQADFSQRRVRVSSILDWFGEDFGPTPQKALQRLATYMPDEKTRRLISSGRFAVTFLEYDWSLNEQ